MQIFYFSIICLFLEASLFIRSVMRRALSTLLKTLWKVWKTRVAIRFFHHLAGGF